MSLRTVIPSTTRSFFNPPVQPFSARLMPTSGRALPATTGACPLEPSSPEPELIENAALDPVGGGVSPRISPKAGLAWLAGCRCAVVGREGVGLPVRLANSAEGSEWSEVADCESVREGTTGTGGGGGGAAPRLEGRRFRSEASDLNFFGPTDLLRGRGGGSESVDVEGAAASASS